MSEYTRDDIIALLLRRHSKDVCAAGALDIEGCPPLDLWVAKRAWGKNPLVVGYWIFAGQILDYPDSEALERILASCNRFYFAGTRERLEGLPHDDRAGLVYVTDDGQGTVVKKHAEHRDETTPPDMHKYIISAQENHEKLAENSAV